MAVDRPKNVSNLKENNGDRKALKPTRTIILDRTKTCKQESYSALGYKFLPLDIPVIPDCGKSIIRLVSVLIFVPGRTRAFHRLLGISQKVSRNLSKSCSNSCSKKVRACFFQRKLLKNIFLSLLSSFIWSDAKICKLYNKNKIVQ